VSIDLTRDLARLSEDELPVLDSRIVELAADAFRAAARGAR
jgi:hypothetical protein